MPTRSRSARALLACALGALTGCEACAPPPDDGPPPEQCLGSGDPGPAPWFVDATDGLGLGDSGLAVDGNLVASADIDGDHWPDLLVSRNVQGLRDAVSAPAYHLRLLRNARGQGFEDVTFSSGFTATRDGGQGRAAQWGLFLDLDNDGDQDAFSATFRGYGTADTGDRSEILRNRGDGTFELGPQNLFSSDPQYDAVISATVLDANRDGWLDLFVGHHYARYGYLNTAGQDSLYHGMGQGSFEDVTDAAGLTTRPVTALSLASGTNHRPTWGVSTCDVDGDGRQDLLVSAYGRQFNLLWRDRGDGTYEDIAQPTGFAADEGLDYSRNDYYRCHCHAYGTTCDPAPPQPRITCPSTDPWTPGLDDQPSRLGGNSVLSSCGDLDHDGDLDLLQVELRHWTFEFDSDSTELLFNEGVGSGGAFSRSGNEVTGLTRAHASTDWNEGDLGGALFDFDHDGRLDALVTSSDYPDTTSLLWRHGDDGRFSNVTADSGLLWHRAHGLSLVDYDRDGDLDVVMGTSLARWAASDRPPRPARGAVRVFRNEVGQSVNRLLLDLDGGPDMNRDALGARITVRAGSDLYVREVVSSHGLAGQQFDYLQIIGVGPHCTVDQVEVRWPDAAGTVTTHADVRANYVLRLHPVDGLRYQTLEEYAPR
jgi:hypothetical protein